MAAFRKGSTVKVTKESRQQKLRGRTGTVKWTWPAGHKYHNKYYLVEVGRVKPTRHILAASVIKAAATKVA